MKLTNAMKSFPNRIYIKFTLRVKESINVFFSATGVSKCTQNLLLTRKGQTLLTDSDFD